MMDFKVGDRVVINDSAVTYMYVMYFLEVGDEGTVIYANEEYIGVEFNKDFGGHSCNGAGADGCCLWFYYIDHNYPTYILTTIDEVSPEKQKVIDSFVEEFYCEN